MKYRVLEMALLQPTNYPWKKAKFGIDSKELTRILKDINLIDEIERRKINKAIRFAILEESKGQSNPDRVADKIKERFNGTIELTDNIISKFQWGLNLDTASGLEAYNGFLNGTICLKKFEENIEKNMFWLVDSTVFKYCSRYEMTLEKIVNNIKKYLEKINITIKYEKYLKSALNKRRFYNDNDLKEFSNDIKEYKQQVSKLFFKLDENNEKNIEIEVDKLSKDFEEDFNIDSIVDIFLNEPTALDFVEDEPKHINDEIQVEEKKEEKQLEVKTRINVSDDLEKEVTITKAKYEKLISNDKEREIKIIKELAHLKNGAVLSELYNCYKNIDNVSKENLEITLSNFFNSLNMYGIEVMEEGKKIGQDIQVDTKEVLKEFIFTSPVEIDGKINGKIEYLGWSYNGKQIVPMVVRPNK